MKESYTEGPASHGDPESCADARKGTGEALTGAHMGGVLSRDNLQNQGADAVNPGEKQHDYVRQGEHVNSPARSETTSTYGNSMRENREIPCPHSGCGPEELQSAMLSHSYRAVVTLTRNITESIIGYVISTKLEKTAGKDLAGHLNILKELLPSSNGELEGISYLCYHMAHRIRLVHARTHIDRAQGLGRSIEPELALSCIENLKEILRTADLVESRQG